ncbi:MAG TPA: anti-sigma factor [Gemmatimonadales bacterium]|nr:anti-sigma factor [Gemmatimonadales bacterium]
MSDGTPETMRDLVAGYSLGALTPEEARAFEAALAISPELQRDLQEFRETNALLALAEGRTPPAELKARLRARIGQAKAGTLPGRPGSGPASELGRRSFTLVVMGAGLAAAILVAVMLSLKVRSLNSALGERSAEVSRIQRDLAAREATLNAILEPATQLVTMVAPGETPPTAQVFFDPRKRTVIVHTFNLRPVSATKTYQLWFLRKKGNPIPSQVFNTEADGRGLVQAIQVPAGEEISGFALTIEPTGGSPQPTSTPFLAGFLPGTK